MESGKSNGCKGKSGEGSGNGGEAERKNGGRRARMSCGLHVRHRGAASEKTERGAGSDDGGGVRSEETRIRSRRAATGGAELGGEARDFELHAAVGEVDGDGGEGGASGVVRGRGVWCWWRVRRSGRAGSSCGRRRRSWRGLGIRPRGDGDNAISLQLPNGSRIVGLPGKEATVRGFSAVSLLLIDEAARVEDAMYKALRPMLAVGGWGFVADEHAVREARIFL